MKRNIRLAAMAAVVAAGAICVSSCGKQKPASVDTDTVIAAETVETVDTTAQTDSAPADLSTYTADFFKGNTGYETTASGLKYATVTEGTGIAPTATDMVTVHYTGRLLDGTVFDSSVQRGEPAQFPLQAVIKGWTEGLQLMKEGGTTVFYIPSDLAYGQMGTPGGPIGPNADLIFEVQLIKVGQ